MSRRYNLNPDLYKKREPLRRKQITNKRIGCGIELPQAGLNCGESYSDGRTTYCKICSQSIVSGKQEKKNA